MDVHQTPPIKNEEATLLLSDLKDGASPPKKRVKHVSDFDSSEQKCVFDLDLGLPKHEPGLEKQWRGMFDFLFYRPERPKVFKDLVSKCREEIAALDSASKKAERFIKEVIAGLEKEKHLRHASMVINDIRNRREMVLKAIGEAREVLNFVEDGVKTYVEFVDDIILNRSETCSRYVEKLEQLLKIPDVGKMIKYLECKDDINYEQIEDCSGLTREDISAFILALRREIPNIIYFHGVEENFGETEMEDVLKANKKSFGDVRVLGKDFENAEDKFKEQMRNFVPRFIRDVDRLSYCLEDAGHGLKIMRKQLELLYKENVIVRGFYKMFLSDWREASIRDPVDEDSSRGPPVFVYSPPNRVEVDSTPVMQKVLYDMSECDD